MWSRYALVREPTPDCQFGCHSPVDLYHREPRWQHASRYTVEKPCLYSAKYALVDLTDPQINGTFFCVAHLCPEHALSILTLSHDGDTLEQRQRVRDVIKGYDDANERQQGEETG